MTEQIQPRAREVLKEMGHNLTERADTMISGAAFGLSPLVAPYFFRLTERNMNQKIKQVESTNDPELIYRFNMARLYNHAMTFFTTFGLYLANIVYAVETDRLYLLALPVATNAATAAGLGLHDWYVRAGKNVSKRSKEVRQ